MWLDDWFSNVWIALVGVWIPLLFPDGRLPSRRWRRSPGAGPPRSPSAILGLALGDRVLDTAAPGTVDEPATRCPGAAGDLAASVAPIAELVLVPRWSGRWPALVVRLRRSRGVERQQLKWFAFVGALMLAALLLAASAWCDPELLGDNVGTVGWSAFLLLVASSACRSPSAPRSCATGSTTSTSSSTARSSTAR